MVEASGARFHVITAVWGEEYIDLFTRVIVPNLLSPGNLDALPEGSRYRIFTAPSDHVRLSEAVRRLTTVLPVDLVTVESAPTNRHAQMTHYHRQGIAEAMQCGAAMIFASPDSLLSAGALQHVVARQLCGVRAVVTPPTRLTKESALSALAVRGSEVFRPRDLVRFALEHLHPATLACMKDSRRFKAFPTSLQWQVGDEGWILRSLHLYPLMIDPVRPVLPTGTIDSHYIERCVPSMDDIEVVTDSDVLSMFDLTAAQNHDGRTKTRTLREWRLACSAGRCTPHHLMFLRHAVLIHAEPLNERWTAVEAASAEVANRVLARRQLARRFLPVLRLVDSFQQRGEHRAKVLRRRVIRATNEARRELRMVKRLLRRGAKRYSR